MLAQIDDYRWLAGPEAKRLLAELQLDQRNLVNEVARLRKSFSATRTSLLVDQIELRQRGREKFFAAADQMLFTRRGLEQASDIAIARYKARRMPGNGPIADLCCGIGGDFAAFAERGIAWGVDRDPACAFLARHNARVLAAAKAGNAITLAADVADFDVGSSVAWHADPDRRPQGRRTTRVELHEPSASILDGLRSRQSLAAIKLAPAAELPAAWLPHCEREWLGRHRQCRQLMAWFAGLTACPGERRATLIDDAGRVLRQVQDRQVPPADAAPAIGRFVFEPDPTIVAARLVDPLAHELGLVAVAPRIAYLTGDRPLDDAALEAFEVREVLPFQQRRLKSLLRERRLGRLEIKKRGVNYDIEQLRRQLRVPGDEAATLLLARGAQGPLAILADRVPTL